MKILLSLYQDAAYNLAFEEYLLKNSKEDFVLLYRNNSSLIVGKHQNAMAEVNYLHAIEHKIPIYRRISGGGTVYHDLGNLNFSFILNAPGNNKVDFKKYTRPIIDFLLSLNLPATLGSRNEILLDGKKISGNAEHVHRDRVLHHGTLLFDSDLEALNSFLQVDILAYKDKSSKSVRSQVVNIKDYTASLSILDFTSQLSFFLGDFFGAEKTKITQHDEEAIEVLVLEKYQSREWNFGYNPSYAFEKRKQIDGQNVFVKIVVEKGIIQSLSISGDNLSEELVFLSECDFYGVYHDYLGISEYLNSKAFFMHLDESFVNTYVKLFF